MQFTALSNGPPASLRNLTALNNQSAVAPLQNVRHPKALGTTHTRLTLTSNRGLLFLTYHSTADWFTSDKI